MSTTWAKAQKEKSYAPAPRFAPRPTAASAARAARYTNRNLSMPTPQRQSPTRGLPSPAPYKGKASSPVRQAQNFDSKSDSKEEYILNAPANYIVDSETTVIIEETSEEQLIQSNGTRIQDTYENDIDATPADQNINEDETKLTCWINHDDVPKSRPQTPLISRPQTPISLQSSRPQTPRLPSRPTTPAHFVQRHSTPTSRPSTPQRLSAPSRPRTSSSVVTMPPSGALTSLPANGQARHPIPQDNDDVKSVYIAKQKQFHHMKKELDLKQQAILEIFGNLRDLRERMSREGVSGGGEGVQLQELVVFNVADWAADEVAQLCKDAAASYATDGAAEIINTTAPLDECTLAELDDKVTNIPAQFADLCLQAFTARQEIIDWAKEFIANNDVLGGETMDRISHYNSQGLELCETLREMKNCADDAMGTITQLSKRACRERSALVSVGESLVREIARLRQDLQAHGTALNEMREMQAENDFAKALEETRRELEDERATQLATKDKLTTTESQLRQTRIRVTKMDRQLREAEASIASLTGTVKALEDQNRQREVQLEARARKLKESLKTNEVTSGQLAQQRESLQAEVLELKEQIETINAQHKATVQELNSQLKDFKSAFEEQQNMNQIETERREAIESELLKYQTIVEELNAKNLELENSKAKPDLPTEREMELWAELQATKDTLRLAEDEVTACKREKVRFLETLTKITESGEKVGIQQKLAAELLSKEEILGKMQLQIRDLTKNIKHKEQKVIQYEQYVRDLQAYNRATLNHEEDSNEIAYQGLQQEIMNLRMSLLEANHRNEELSEELIQKEQKIDQQDKTSRAQARVIKVNKQITAKAEKIQELFRTLENKQQQIHRLEKIVLALEEHERRAQAQRTRREEKIAALEHELAANGRRERKFLFF